MGIWDWIFDATGLGEVEEVEPYYTGTGNPLADPLLNYASQYALMQMGMAPDPTMTSQGSPIAVAVSRLLQQSPNEPSLIRGFIEYAGELVQSIASGGDVYSEQADHFRLNQLAGAIGMSATELIQAQKDYTVQQGQQLDYMQQVASLNQQTQLDVQQQLASLIGDLPDVSATGIESYKAQEKDRLLSELNLYVDEASGAAMRQANFANYNPGRVLGDLEEARVRGSQDADLASLEYALSMLGGMQNLSTARTGQLQGYISAPQQYMAQLAGIRGSGLNAPTQAVAPQMIPGLTGRALGELGGFASDVGEMVGAAAAAYGSCWCAAVYYPYFTPNWWDCRTWITEGWSTPVGRTFRWLYLRYGERMSRVLKRRKLLRDVARPLFVWIRRKGAEYRWQTDPK